MHRYSICPCPYGMNIHEMNYGIISDVLENHKNLIDRFWCKDTFMMEDFIEMRHLHDTAHYSPTEAQPPTGHTYSDAATFECFLTDGQMGLIAQCANEAHLFCNEVSTDSIKRLLRCEKGFFLYANRLNRIAKLFDLLSFHHLICGKWQHVLSANELIRSSKTGLPVKRGNLASALSQLNKRDDDAVTGYIEQTVKEVKAMGKTDRNTNK